MVTNAQDDWNRRMAELSKEFCPSAEEKYRKALRRAGDPPDE